MYSLNDWPCFCFFEQVVSEHCDDHKIDLMYRHWQLMLKWNARTNLTAIRELGSLERYADGV